jgi:hypothetical protein
MVVISHLPDTGRYEASFEPEDATIKDLAWSSSNHEVVGIDPVSGVIAARASGSAVITATTTQGGKTASVEVFVNGIPPAFGKNYCTITGYGDYNANQVATVGAIQDLSHSNASIPLDSYGYYEGERLVVERSEAFTLNLVQSNSWSRSLVWIDWNRDKDFADDGELVAVFGNFEELNEGTFSQLITVPENATLGLSRMRVIAGDAWTLNLDLELLEPCGSIPHGTIKDFEVEIQ